jgi:hypothetical protein
MNPIRLPEKEVMEILSRLHGIINRDDPASEKIIIIHRLNDDYFKVAKTQDQFGFSLYDVLSELGRLTYANYHNSVLTNHGDYLHSFIKKIEQRDVYMEFPIRFSLINEREVVALYSFHENE